MLVLRRILPAAFIILGLLALHPTPAPAAEPDPAQPPHPPQPPADVDVDVLRELLERLEALDFADAPAAFDLAEWSLQQNMPQYAIDLYHRTLDADPLHAPAYDRLHELAGVDDLRDDPAQQQELRDELGPAFSFDPGEHFLLVHDADPDDAAAAAHLLARTHGAFVEAFEQADFRLRPLRERLVVLMFTERADFERYARDVDGVHRDWSLGQYAPATNRVAVHRQPNDQPRTPEEQIEAIDDEIAQLEQAVRDARQQRDAEAARELGRALLEARREREQLVRQARRGLSEEMIAAAEASETARLSHEAAHQLAYNTGLLRRGVVYPLWIDEGLATNFEAVADDAPIGPAADNPHRQAAAVHALRRGAMRPLVQLATLVDAPDDPAAARDLYAQSWALFRFLYHEQPEQLRRYLAKLYVLPRGELDQQALAAAFHEAFGPPAALQRDFAAYLRTLRR